MTDGRIYPPDWQIVESNAHDVFDFDCSGAPRRRRQDMQSADRKRADGCRTVSTRGHSPRWPPGQAGWRTYYHPRSPPADAWRPRSYTWYESPHVRRLPGIQESTDSFVSAMTYWILRTSRIGRWRNKTFFGQTYPHLARPALRRLFAGLPPTSLYGVRPCLTACLL